MRGPKYVRTQRRCESLAHLGPRHLRALGSVGPGVPRAKEEQGIESASTSNAGVEPAQDPLEKEMRCSPEKHPQRSTELPG